MELTPEEIDKLKKAVECALEYFDSIRISSDDGWIANNMLIKANEILNKN